MNSSFSVLRQEPFEHGLPREFTGCVNCYNGNEIRGLPDCLLLVSYGGVTCWNTTDIDMHCCNSLLYTFV